MKVTIVGLGLIGGSMAIDIRKAGFASELIGVDIHSKHVQEAQALGLVDRVLPEDKALNIADLVILAIPVNTLSALLPSILDTIRDNTVVIDAGRFVALLTPQPSKNVNDIVSPQGNTWSAY